MNILVTGASGFVGKNLLGYLPGKQTIQTPSRDALSNASSELLIGVASIIHLAGKAHDLKKTSNLNEYYHVNYELTKKLYDAFLESNAKKFIFISSVKATADYVAGVLTEDIIPNPQTHYGKSKLMAEEYIQSQILPEGKSYFILRPCMIHGPGNKGNFNLLYKLIKKKIPYPLAAFQNKRSFLSIQNLCFIIHQLLINPSIPGGIYLFFIHI